MIVVMALRRLDLPVVSVRTVRLSLIPVLFVVGQILGARDRRFQLSESGHGGVELRLRGRHARKRRKSHVELSGSPRKRVHLLFPVHGCLGTGQLRPIRRLVGIAHVAASSSASLRAAMAALAAASLSASDRSDVSTSASASISAFF